MDRATGKSSRKSSKHDRNTRIVLDCLRRIVRALRLFDREAERRVGLSGAQVFVLQKLGDGNSISVNDLADRTQTDQSSVSAVAQKLVKRGLAARSRSAADARIVHLSITARGHALLKAAPNSAQDRLILAINRMPASHRRQLGDLLTELIGQTDMKNVAPMMFFEDRKRKDR